MGRTNGISVSNQYFLLLFRSLWRNFKCIKAENRIKRGRLIK